jgi:phage tail-like protein
MVLSFQPTGQRVDPYKGFNFLVRLLGSTSQLATGQLEIQTEAAAGFSECSGLETTLELEPYQQGGNNGTVLQFPTRVTWGNIRLKRGMAVSDELWNWHYGFVEGRGQRRDGLIILQDEQQQPVKIWQFKRGLPAKWTGPSLNAAQNQIAVEELEIAHEGLLLATA